MEEQDFLGPRVGMSASTPPPEQARPDAAVDRLARFAAALCETPMAVVTVVADSRQWFKSVIGLRLCDTADSMAHSARTVEALETFIVNDVIEGRLALDAGSPGPVRIRFYRGVPLVSPGGAPLGTLAVMDHVPRELTASQAESLDILAEQLSVQFELRRQHALAERLTSERLRAVEASRRQARLLITALDEVTDAFCVLDLDWRLTYANREFERLLQRPRSEILGKPVWDEFEEAIGSRFDVECHRAMAQRQTVAFEYLCSLGMWLEVRAFPCVQGLTVYLRDVSERKRREEEQRVLEAQLRQAQKMESVGTLAGGIAHDFNNVLGAVLANVALARDDIAPDHPAQAHLALIHSASQRAAHLVQKILAFS
ncbi:MAG: two-component hybrid sensor and regulator, partial [Rhizobacter sp.]|nr:two-component hybrid sensor and regulator [Rhizobacter sp.]